RVPPLDPLATEPPTTTISSPPAITIPPPPPPRVVVISRPSPVRTAGIVVSVAGVATLAAGAGFVIASVATYAKSASLCDAQSHCSAPGTSLRSDPLTHGDDAP